MTHVMIDCETLSLDPNAVVVSIGLVRFDPRDFAIGSVCEWNLNIQEQLDAGRQISGSTLQWWMRQSETARAPLTYEGSPVVTALKELRASTADATGVWASAPDKDFPWLDTLGSAFGLTDLLNFRAQRCFRTIREVHDPDYELSPPQFGACHKASDDAMYQTLYLKNIVEKLGIQLAR